MTRTEAAALYEQAVATQPGVGRKVSHAYVKSLKPKPTRSKRQR